MAPWTPCHESLDSPLRTGAPVCGGCGGDRRRPIAANLPIVSARYADRRARAAERYAAARAEGR